MADRKRHWYTIFWEEWMLVSSAVTIIDCVSKDVILMLL
jgi:hypothetical protein